MTRLWIHLIHGLCVCWRRPPADRFSQATTSLYKLRGLLLTAQQQQAGAAAAAADTASAPPPWVAAMAAPDASWRVEEAKLLWAQGQQDTAVQLARSLLGAGAGPAAAAPPLQHAYLRTLTAKWLSCTRSDSPSTVLSLMQVRWWGGGPRSQVACRKQPAPRGVAPPFLPWIPPPPSCPLYVGIPHAGQPP